MPGAFGTTGAGSLDFDEATAEGGLASASDQPSHFYVAQQAFADLDADGQLDYLTGTVGNRIATFAVTGLVGDAAGPRVIFDHLLSAWTAATGVPKPAFPRVIEDWQFVTGPAVADLTGDGLPEALATSGGYYVHAFNAAGLEPAGWPKRTGQWQTATPSIGDLDGDGTVEVVQPSRLGTLFVWRTGGATCQPDQWRKFRHDEWNTGTYGADTRRPARIDDLRFAAAGSGVRLDWTAVGDDARCGTADRYELRASATPITSANFASAAPGVIAGPAAAGAAETRTFTPPPGAVFFALRAVDEAGNAGPLATVGAFELRKTALTRPGGGRDKASLRGRVAGTLAQLGLPGQDVTITLANAGPPFLTVTVPAASLVPNRSGTMVRFRGTIAGSPVTLRLGGRTRTDVALSARNQNLAAATAGAFTATLHIGAVELTAMGTLRPIGARLVFP